MPPNTAYGVLLNNFKTTFIFICLILYWIYFKVLVFSQLTMKRVTPLSYKIHGKIKKHMYHFIDTK